MGSSLEFSVFPGLVCFLCHVRKFFNHYVFNYVLRILLFLSFPSRISVTQILMSLALSQRSSKLHAFIFPSFSSVQCWWLPLLSSSSVTIALYHLVYCWLLLMYFSFLYLSTHFALEFLIIFTVTTLNSLGLIAYLHFTLFFFWSFILFLLLEHAPLSPHFA